MSIRVRPELETAYRFFLTQPRRPPIRSPGRHIRSMRWILGDTPRGELLRWVHCLSGVPDNGDNLQPYRTGHRTEAPITTRNSDTNVCLDTAIREA